MAVAHGDIAYNNTAGSGEVAFTSAPPVTKQPQTRDWLYKKGYEEHPMISGPPPLAPLFPEAPAGLAHLVEMDTVVIKQIIHLFEVLTGWEIENEYRILNDQGHQIMFCKEESNTCARQCLGEGRPFVMNITNNEKTDTYIQLHRPYRCVGCLCWCCCMQEMEIHCPPGRVIGHMKQVWTACYPRYQITDESGTPLFYIGADFVCCVCCDDIVFKIHAGKDETGEIGSIRKHWMGCAELISCNNFTVKFPKEMPVMHKSLILGAVFLLDMVYFEYKDNNHSH